MEGTEIEINLFFAPDFDNVSSQNDAQMTP